MWLLGMKALNEFQELGEIERERQVTMHFRDKSKWDKEIV